MACNFESAASASAARRRATRTTRIRGAGHRAQMTPTDMRLDQSAFQAFPAEQIVSRSRRPDHALVWASAAPDWLLIDSGKRTEETPSDARLPIRASAADSG